MNALESFRTEDNACAVTCPVKTCMAHNNANLACTTHDGRCLPGRRSHGRRIAAGARVAYEAACAAASAKVAFETFVCVIPNRHGNDAWAGPARVITIEPHAQRQQAPSRGVGDEYLVEIGGQEVWFNESRIARPAGRPQWAIRATDGTFFADGIGAVRDVRAADLFDDAASAWSHQREMGLRERSHLAEVSSLIAYANGDWRVA